MSSYLTLTSNYLQQTTKTLKELRLKQGASVEEVFACSPLDSEFLKDTRTEYELSQTINALKMIKQIKATYNERIDEYWVIICCGSFSPIHNSHIQMSKQAANKLQEMGKTVLMSYYIPNNPSYTALKIQKRGEVVPDYLKPEHIEGSLRATFADEPAIDVCFIDLHRISYCEWFICSNELINLLRDTFPDTNFKFVVVGGEDLVRSPGQLYKGTKVVDFIDMIMMVPRNMDEEKRKRYPLADDVIVLPEADVAMSSTKVRQCLKDNNFQQLEHDLHPNTLKYLTGI